MSARKILCNYKARNSKVLAASFCSSLLSFFVAADAHAATYIFAGEANGVDIITHPTGYTGAGGNITVNICIVPGSANAASMEIPVQNVVNVFNSLSPTSPNLEPANVPFTQYDFESVLLHEVGHCIGAAHTNLGVQTGVGGANTDYTNTTDGLNNTFTFNDGPDNVIGTSDDIRGDDSNLHWFDKATNNPFSPAPLVQGSTFSRLLSDLPPGDNFAANGTRDVGAALGFPDTEAVMNQGTFNGEAQRTLAADDVHGVDLAKTGLDEVAGTGDDYTVTLNYAGITSNAALCDINLQFDATAGFAFCSVGGTFIGTNHISITSANMFFDTDAVTWFFNQVPNTPTGTTCDGQTVDVDLNLGQSPTTGNDVILGTPGPDIIDALAGNDIICGEGGDDIIDAGGGDDQIFGGPGDDRIYGRTGTDTILAGDGDDTVFGGSDADIIYGEVGDDVLFGQPGNDTIYGGNGVDGINGGGGNDTIYTGPGATVGTPRFASGNVGNDIIYGGPSADDLRGFNGMDTIEGGGGNDVISGGIGRDTIDGQAGNDIIKGQDSNDTLTGGSGMDDINGGNGADIIAGGPDDDILVGGPGGDDIDGDGGSDDIKGGSGNDTLAGGGGSGDVCNGQTGTDTADSTCETEIGIP